MPCRAAADERKTHDCVDLVTTVAKGEEATVFTFAYADRLYRTCDCQHGRGQKLATPEVTRGADE